MSKKNIWEHGGEHCLTCTHFTPYMVSHKFYCKKEEMWLSPGICGGYSVNELEYYDPTLPPHGGIGVYNDR